MKQIKNSYLIIGLVICLLLIYVVPMICYPPLVSTIDAENRPLKLIDGSVALILIFTSAALGIGIILLLVVKITFFIIDYIKNISVKS